MVIAWLLVGLCRLAFIYTCILIWAAWCAIALTIATACWATGHPAASRTWQQTCIWPSLKRMVDEM